MKLTPNQLEAFERDGYLFFPSLFTPAEIAVLHAAVPALYARREVWNVREKGSDLDYISDRMRDTHDLWHAVTGYKGDLIGEASLLGFSLAQTHNPGIAMIVLTLAVMHAERLAVRKPAETYSRVVPVSQPG